MKKKYFVTYSTTTGKVGNFGTESEPIVSIKQIRLIEEEIASILELEVRQVVVTDWKEFEEDTNFWFVSYSTVNEDRRVDFGSAVFSIREEEKLGLTFESPGGISAFSWRIKEHLNSDLKPGYPPVTFVTILHYQKFPKVDMEGRSASDTVQL